MTLFTSSESITEFGTSLSFNWVWDFFNWIQYHFLLFVFYLHTFAKRDEVHNCLDVGFQANSIDIQDLYQPKNKKTVSFDDENAVTLKWNKSMLKMFEQSLELDILPKNSWILDMSYDDGEFTKLCAFKYPDLNFVFFANHELTLPTNVHVFIVSPDAFVNQSNDDYEDFALKNKVSYRRIFVSQKTEYWHNIPALFERIDKCLYKDYGNTIKSTLTIFKLTHTNDARYLPLLTPNFTVRPIQFLKLFDRNVKEVFCCRIQCDFEDAIKHLPLNEQRAVLTSFYERTVFMSKHVFHPVNDFVE